jgi:hypothetical protein
VKNVISLISASPGSAVGKTNYTFGFAKGGISGDTSAAFVKCNMLNAWAENRVSDANNDSIYEFTVELADGPVMFVYGGNLTGASWGYIREDQYYSSANDALYLEVRNGQIYKIGTAPAIVTTPPPSVSGNTSCQALKFVSSFVQPDGSWKYDLKANSACISGAKTAPFLFWNVAAWKPALISDQDNDGWYEFSFTTRNETVYLTYGGNYQANSWAYIKSDAQYDSMIDALNIEFRDGNIY